MSYNFSVKLKTRPKESEYDKIVEFGRLNPIKRSIKDVELVVSYCNEEDTVGVLERHITELQTKGVRADITYYCKCEAKSFCDTFLPNIGREGQTFMWHVFYNYDSLYPTTVFINGGFLSKTHTSYAVEKIFNNIGQVESVQEMPGLQRTHDFYVDEQVYYNGSIFSRARSSHTTKVNCMEVNEYCSADENLCSVSDLPCVDGSRCGCQPQSNCSWTGLTQANLKYQNGHLEPLWDDYGREHSFFTWACKRLNILPATIVQCGYSWGAVFAVSRNRLHRLSSDDYHNILLDYNVSGGTGGVLVHYMERLYRTVYFC